MKPIILISTEDGISGDGVGHFVINKKYVEAITSAGGIPVIATDIRCVKEYSNLADGLLLTNGPHIHASYYGKYYQNFEEMDGFSRTRDDLDFALVEAFKSKNKAIFGIGRGIEVINISYGGTLKRRKEHSVFKHQIDQLGEGLVVEAYDQFGAIKSIRKGNIYGIYQHVERSKDNSLLTSFIKEAKS